ncbi:MAG: DNA replication/repair protein RecF [Clostridia bacterium]|nr:DNA replication/repair protein RecF [Clostridia bacterium]
MYITGAEFKNFRNYENLKITFSPGINLIYGDNAQGKTNLIEGIYFCSMAKSFKFSPDMGFVTFGKEKGEISTEYISENRKKVNRIEFEKKKGKKIEVNGVPIKRRIDFIGNLNVVLFSPQDMDTVKESPLYRRKYMDLCAGQLRKKYLSALADYNRTLAQKNKLLKEENAAYTLDIWNEKLAEYGSVIMWFRISLVNRIKEIIKPIFDEISEGREEIKLKYLKTVQFDESGSADYIKEEFLKALNLHKNKEIAEKTCLVGPHRDDLLFYINGKNAKIYGSQGQQKSIVLALKMVQTELFYQQTGQYPVLLLDDITSEFDLKRRGYLMSRLKDKQVIITGTEKSIVPSELGAKLFKVEKGVITEV